MSHAVQSSDVPLPRSFFLLLSGQLISQIGDKVYLLALSYWVMETTKSASQMGLVLGAATASMVICGLFTGSLADRWNRKSILVVTDILRGLVILAVAIAIHYQALTISMVILSEILVAALGSLFNATEPALIPELVAERSLSRANGRKAFVYAFSCIAGPALGGLLASRYGYEATVFFNAWSFLVAAVSTALLPYHCKIATFTSSALRELKEGYVYLFSSRRLTSFLGIVIVLHVFAGSLQVAVPLIAGALQGNYAQNLGGLQTAMGIGSVAMAGLFSTISIHRREVPALLISITVMGACYAAMSMFLNAHGARTLWPYLVTLAVASGGLVIASSAFETYIQSNADNTMAGRIFGIMNSMGSSTMALSMVGFGACAERFHLKATLAVSGILMSLFAVLFLSGTSIVLAKGRARG